MDGKHITLVTIGTVLMVLVAATRLGGYSTYEDGARMSPASGAASVTVLPGDGKGFAAKNATHGTRMA
jgi:hypothetical protein